jgi:hypothetical protein
VRLMGAVLCCVVLLYRREAGYSAADGCCAVLCSVVLLCRREARYIKYDFCAHSLCDVFDAEVLMLRLIEYKL